MAIWNQNHDEENFAQEQVAPPHRTAEPVLPDPWYGILLDYRGDKNGVGYLPVPAEKCGGELLKPIVGRGSAYADIDGDGDLDVILTQVGGPPLLLRNEQKLGHHWLRLKLVGTKSNRDAIGAWVKARVGGHTLSRQVMPTRSYLSQSELPVTIGLGKAEKVDGLEIAWPSGTKQKLDSLPIDRLSVVTEPR